MITSTRLRMAKKPGDETPGAVSGADETPAAEPVAAETVAPESSEQTASEASPSDAATPPAAPASRKGLVIGLVAGGAALVLVAIVAVVALVLPGLLRGGAAENAADVADIATKPEDTWTFDWVGDADPEFLEDSPEIAAVGTDAALVWSTFDYYAYTDTLGNSEGWYEGYDEHYSDGYAAGLEYEAAVDAYWESTDFSLDFPSDEDFYPEGAYGNYDEWLGFDDGFWDARLGEDKGYSKKVEPVAPEYTPTLTLLTTDNGDESWTVDLAAAIDGVDFSSTFYAFDVPGSNAIAVSASTSDEEATAYSVVTLSRSDGEVISELESDGPVSADAFGGDLIVTTSDEDGEKTTVARYSVDGLDGDPKWEEDGPDSSFGATAYPLGTEFLQVIGDDEGVILNAATGEEADFGDDVDYSVGYDFAGGQLIRSESTDESTELEGWNTSDDSTWDDAITADYARVVDGSIFTAEADGDVYTALMAINPSNGDELWDEAFTDEIDGVYGVRNGTVLVVSETTLIMLDASTGEKKFSQKLGDVSALYEGLNAYYVSTDKELSAYSYAEKGDLWSFKVDDERGVILIGTTLGLIDFEAGTLHGLSAR